MRSPLLDTKLSAPRARTGVVPRPSLTERLIRGAAAKLVLVSAPAGFGKTTLLAESLAASPSLGPSVAWLSLDRSDNDPLTFWTYVIAALRTALPDVGAGALALLPSGQPPPIEAALSSLINDLAAEPADIVLVLDDYHAVDAPEVQTGMAFLLDHLPPRVHVAMATRADPALPLARLRARGELVEIRAADLRFTRDEAADYLNEVMRLGLRASDVDALEARTEGWIAALQLAALSMQGRDDPAGFIASFAGDDRYVVDYLVEEVLHRQPGDVRDFLLQTSILDRLSGPLCDAVTGQTGGRATLEALERANLFVVALDDRRQWYRYHRLFADVLLARLRDERRDLAPELHRRASAWYQRTGESSLAIDHALAAEDFGRAADLIELALPALRQARQEQTLGRWLDALPEGLFGSRPVLTVHRAGVLLANGELDGAEARLRDAERWLVVAERAREPTRPGDPPVVVRDEDGLRRLPAQIAMYRAARAQALGDASSAMAQARRVLDLVGDDDDFERGAAAGFLGLAEWGSGELEVAHRHWSDAMASLRRAGHVVDAIGCARPLAQIRLAQGRLHEAMRIYERGLRMATEQGPALRGAADMHVGMAEVLLEWNDLEGATTHLLASQELGDHAGLAQNASRWRIVMARSREIHGDPDGALDLLREAEHQSVSEYYPDVRPIGALRARIWARQGRVTEAREWVDERGLSVDDDLSYLREFEHLTLARVALAQPAQNGAAASRTAQRLLARLLAAAEEGGRVGSVIEISILQALAHHQAGELSDALSALERALRSADAERYVRVFVDEGPLMAALLAAAGAHGIVPGYVARLSDAMRTTAGPTRLNQGLAEPLSAREIDVLRLLDTELDGPGIAAELVVGLSTVRSHTKSIYAKLGVHGRPAALRRARELGLLPGARSS